MDQNLKPILLVSPLALEAEFLPSMDFEATVKCTNTGTIKCGDPGEVSEE